MFDNAGNDKESRKVMQSEYHTSKDPITEFVECLYVNFDFDRAQKMLRGCALDDLMACHETFIENAPSLPYLRLLVISTNVPVLICW